MSKRNKPKTQQLKELQRLWRGQRGSDGYTFPPATPGPLGLHKKTK
jgi:hypothetical protein